MSVEERYHSGHDVKSLALNLSSLLLILLPGAMYFYPQFLGGEIGVVAASFAIAVLLPPLGWKRPHPYTDKPGNVPYRMMPSSKKGG